MIQTWKLPHIFKGILSHVGPLTDWHFRRGHTGGTDRPQYCFSEWCRCLDLLRDAGFNPQGCRIAELGPGDTIGIGLAALLSGVSHYTGLDAVPFSRNFDPLPFYDDLCRLAAENKKAFQTVPEAEIQRLKVALAGGLNGSEVIRYEAPWKSDSVTKGSLDLVLSVGVLQHIDRLEEVFQTMYAWLRPGGFSCHIVPINALFLSPYWNGHWAYSDLEWRLVRGRRPFLNNRQPVSTYLKVAKAAGFEVLLTQTAQGTGGLPESALAPRFRNMDAVDSTSRQLRFALRKPGTPKRAG